MKSFYLTLIVHHLFSFSLYEQLSLFTASFFKKSIVERAESYTFANGYCSLAVFYFHC